MNYQGPCRASNSAEVSVMEMTAEFLAMAKANMERGQLREALFDLDNALCLMPKSVHAHCNRAQALLSLGDYAEGFKEFEWRFLLFGDPFVGVDVPVWRGQDIVGKRLLVCHESGYGDSLMMFRYVPVLKAIGAIVTLLIPPGLVRIARKFDVEVMDRYPDDYGVFDYCCPIFSVIPALKHGVSDIPSEPYIKAEESGSNVPFISTSERGSSPRPEGRRFGWGCADYKANTRDRSDCAIGIAWSGNRLHVRDAHRSVGIEKFLSLFESNGKTIYSVQNSELEQAACRGVVTQSFNDLAETAVFMSRMDHIVTVDSAPAHLAGAIGHPSVHLLLPYVSDWRWYNSQAWYPKIKTYRQDSPGDWASAFAKVNTCLSAT